MAYFSNGSEGQCFDEQCAICKYGESPCPIAAIQMEFKDAVLAYKELLACYRLNRPPSEKLLKRLEKADKSIDEVEV